MGGDGSSGTALALSVGGGVARHKMHVCYEALTSLFLIIDIEEAPEIDSMHKFFFGG